MKCKEVVEKYVRAVAPHHALILNNLAFMKYGTSFVDLLFSDPPSFFKLLTDIYGGDEGTAKCVLSFLIAKPLSQYLNLPITDITNLIIKNKRKFLLLSSLLC